MRQRAEALADIDRAKTAFFSNVSHEFRTPLTLLLGPIENLLANVNGPLTDAQRNDVEVLQRNAGRSLKLVNGLLAFSRIEAGRAQPILVAVTGYGQVSDREKSRAAGLTRTSSSLSTCLACSTCSIIFCRLNRQADRFWSPSPNEKGTVSVTGEALDERTRRQSILHRRLTRRA